MSAIAYFAPRALFLALLADWFVNRPAELMAAAMARDGWEFATYLAYTALIVLIPAAAALMTFANIAFTVRGDTFGRNPQNE